MMHMKLDKFLLVTGILRMYDFEVATQDIIRILPSNHAVDTSNCYSDLDCRTLSEWIENGTSPFTNDTTVVLLPGLHLINSTKDRLITGTSLSNDSLTDFLTITVTFVGEQGLSMIKCLHQFSFDFINLKSVTVSNISFTSCALAILYTIEPIDPYINTSDFVQRNKSVLEDDLLTDILKSTFIIFSKMGKMNLKSSVHILGVDFIETSVKVLCEIQNQQIQLLIMQKVTFERVIESLPAALSIEFVTEVIFIDLIFQNNYSPLIKLENFVKVVFEGDCIFHGNSGELGVNISNGMIFTLPFNTKLEYTNNIQHYGFLIHVNTIVKLDDITSVNIWSSVIVVQNNTIRSGGILEIFCRSEMHIGYTNILFRNNRGLESILPLFHEDTAIMLVAETSIYITESVFTFLYNTAELGGGMTLLASTLFLSGKVTFTFDFNQGKDGGAMAFYAKSRIYMGSNSNINISFHHNKALRRGGAIFVKDSDYVDSITKSIDGYIIYVPQVLDSIIINFSNNSADLAGNQIYGGFIDAMFFNYGLQILKLPKNDLNVITSNPMRICICLHSFPLCNITEHRVKLFPGETFKIEAVAVGQRMGIVPSIVLAQFNDEEGRLGEGQDVQSVGRECTILHFTIYSSKAFKKLSLNVQQIGVPAISSFPLSNPPLDYKLLYQQLSVSIYLRNCPYGFVFHETSKECQCLHLFNLHKGVGCHFNNGDFEITRSKDKWMLASFKHTSNHNTQGVIIHDHCPYGYCRTDADSLTFRLETPDDQCAFNRSGILCGACQANLSQVLGTSRCRECSSDMLAIIIPVVVLSGVVLVAFLMILNLTVSTGTVNGLIFYANIIRASQAVFFPPEINGPGSVLSVFIAWLNLDLGIETCFYDGLDAYAKTWLQFVFPFYILLLVLSIIVASRYSSAVSRFFGNDAVQVLATLFFLCYAKILRVVIAVFSFTILIYPDGSKVKVWLLDGNIEFMRGKHIPLFVVSFLVLSVLSIPYTISLVSIQLLQKISHYRVLFWVNRLMPLFDAYTGPYKPKHRYWTGLLLVLRIILMFTFSINYSNNPAVDLLAIALVDFALVTYCFYIGVYKSNFVNALEVTSLLNLGLLTALTFYQLAGKRNIDLFTKLSNSIAFILFIIVILYHAAKKLTVVVKKSKRGFQTKIPQNTLISKFNLL